MKKTLRIRNRYLIVFLLMLGFMGYKSLQGLEKVSAYEKAELFFREAQYAEAEKVYFQILSNPWFHYKENRIRSIYQQLTDVKLEVSAYNQKATDAYQHGEFQELNELYKDYVVEKKARTDDPIFTHFTKFLKTDALFTSHFTAIIQDSFQTMDGNVRDRVFKEEDFYQVLVTIPEEFFKNKKQKARQLNSKFKKYDQAKYRYNEKTMSFTQLTTDMENQLQLYKDLGISADWLKSSLKDHQVEHDKELARIEQHRIQKAKELKAAAEKEKENNEEFQLEIMTVVNEYVTSWVSAYNKLDSSYFVNTTPELHKSLDQQLQIFTNKGAVFIGELQQTIFDVDSFTYNQASDLEKVELKLELSMYSATYLENEDYELDLDTTAWLYTLTNSGDGWKLTDRKELNTISFDRTRVFDFESDSSDY